MAYRRSSAGEGFGVPAYRDPAWLHPKSRAYLEARGVTQADTQGARLGFCEFGRWHDRILIPLYDHFSQQLLAYQGRTIINAPLRYITTSGPRPLYVPWQTYTDPRHRLVLAEGPFDAIRLTRLIPTVASLGDKPSDWQIETLLDLIEAYDVQELLVWYDATAIQEAYDVQRRLHDLIRTTVVVDLHEKDPGGADEQHLRAILLDYLGDDHAQLIHPDVSLPTHQEGQA